MACSEECKKITTCLLFCGTHPDKRVMKWAIFVFSIVTWVLAVVAVAHCSFIKVGAAYTDESLGIGLFSFETEDGCESYEGEAKSNFGSAEKSSRAFGTIAALLTGLGMVLVIVMVLFVKLDILWMTNRIVYICALVAQLLSFCMFGSDICSSDLTCSIGTAGLVAVINVGVLVSIIINTWFIEAPDPIFAKTSAKPGAPTNQSAGNQDIEFPHGPNAPEGPVGDDVEIIIEIDADGNKKTTKTVTKPNGSQNITTTIEQVA